MTTWFWQILGIEPTKDIKTIKNAYAAKSKEYHPEEHPREFQQLQSAYKEAVQYAKQSEEKEPVISESFSDDKIVIQEWETKKKQEILQELTSAVKNEFRETPIIKTEYFDYDAVSVENPEDKFWEHLQYILWHPFVRKNADYWLCFLKQTYVQKLMENADFRKRFIKRLKKENFIWKYDVLNCLDHYLEDFQDDTNYINRPASSQLSSGTIKICLSQNKNSYDSKEEQEIYQAIWWSREEKERKNTDFYLNFYFAYAEANQKRLQEVHKEAHVVRRNRPFKLILRWVVALIVSQLFVAFVEYANKVG